MAHFNFDRINKQWFVTNAVEFKKYVISEDAYNMACEIADNLDEYVTAIIADRVLYLVAPTDISAQLYCVVAVRTEEGVKFYDDEGNEIAILNGDIAFTELDEAMKFIEAFEKVKKLSEAIRYLDTILEQSPSLKEML